MGRERGNILITVILMMVILLVIAAGITSIGSGGLENSVISRKDIEATSNTESIGEMIRKGTNWATGSDEWIADAVVSADVVGKNKLVLKLFIDNKSKDVDMSFDTLTSASSIYVTAVKDNLTGFNVSMVSAPAGAVFSTAAVKSTTASAAWVINPFQSGNYKMRITNPDSEEYIVFVRIFCRE